MKPGRTVYVVNAEVSKDEQAIVQAAARAEGLTISAFIRSCINDRLAELGENVPLLRERRSWRKGQAA